MSMCYVYLSISRSISRSLDLSISRSLDLSISRSLDLSIYRSIDLYLSLYISLSLSIYIYIYTFLYFTHCMGVCYPLHGREGLKQTTHAGGSDADLRARPVFVLRSCLFKGFGSVRISLSRGEVTRHTGSSQGNSTRRTLVYEMSLWKTVVRPVRIQRIVIIVITVVIVIVKVGIPILLLLLLIIIVRIVIIVILVLNSNTSNSGLQPPKGGKRVEAQTKSSRSKPKRRTLSL